MVIKLSIQETKENKKNRLLDTGFKLFTEKGIQNTSIQDIVDNANVAKGTFYLYFKDKYELRDILVAKKSHKLFCDALENSRKNYISNFSDQIIYIINYVIDELTKFPALLKFISKNLSWGIKSNTVFKIYNTLDDNKDGLRSLFIKGIEENKINIKNPDVVLFMIIELASSTCFNSILYNDPMPIDEFKPYLYNTIRSMLKGDSI